MSHRQPYTYQIASDSGYVMLQDPSKTSTTVPESLSDRTPLIKGPNWHANTRQDAGETSLPEQAKPFGQLNKSPQGLTSAVLGFDAAAEPSYCDSYSGPNTSDVSLSLVNSGSVARDHLASERTFLAYVRTSLAIASAGVALAQILTITEFYSDVTPVGHASVRKRRVETWARPLGATAVVIALFTLFVGVARYFAIQKALVGGRFPTSHIGICLMSILFGALIVATFGVLFHHQVITSW